MDLLLAVITWCIRISRVERCVFKVDLWKKCERLNGGGSFLHFVFIGVSLDQPRFGSGLIIPGFVENCSNTHTLLFKSLTFTITSLLVSNNNLAFSVDT